jgi:hypothetical protein
MMWLRPAVETAMAPSAHTPWCDHRDGPGHATCGTLLGTTVISAGVGVAATLRQGRDVLPVILLELVDQGERLTVALSVMRAREHVTVLRHGLWLAERVR